MEATGLAISSPLLAQNRPALEAQMRVIETQAIQMAGRAFLLTSPKQVCEVLFDELKLVLPPELPKRSSAEPVLQALRTQHPLPGLLIEHRRLAKLLR